MNDTTPKSNASNDDYIRNIFGTFKNKGSDVTSHGYNQFYQTSNFGKKTLTNTGR